MLATNSTVDLLVGDIYGQGMGYDKIGEQGTIASSFVSFKRKEAEQNGLEDNTRHKRWSRNTIQQHQKVLLSNNQITKSLTLARAVCLHLKTFHGV